MAPLRLAHKIQTTNSKVRDSAANRGPLRLPFGKQESRVDAVAWRHVPFDKGFRRGGGGMLPLAFKRRVRRLPRPDPFHNPNALPPVPQIRSTMRQV